MQENNDLVSQFDILMKPAEVAEVLNVSAPLAYRLMREGKIPTIKIGGARRVQKKDLESYIQKNRTSKY